MKNSKSLNLGNRVFLLDESAYIKFETYYAVIKNHFLRYTNGAEKLKDIEFDIADSMEKFLTETKSEINLADIETIIEHFGYSEEWNSSYSLSDDYSESRNKRLYRSSRDKILSGLCAGTADYLGIERFLFRVLFTILTIFLPFLLLVYIIAWIAVPEEGSTEFNQTVNFSKKAKPIMDTTANIVTKVFGVLLLIISISVLASFLVAVKLSYDYFSFYHFSLYLFEGPQNQVFLLSAFAVLLIPFILLLLISIKLLWQNSVPRYTFSTLLLTWLTTIVVTVFSVLTLIPEFEDSSSIVNKRVIPVNIQKPLEIEFDDYSEIFNMGVFQVNYNIVAGFEDSLMIKIRKRARGFDSKNARENAEHINLSYKIVDNKIVFDRYFTLDDKRYRAQEMDIDVYVPENMNVYIDNFDRRFVDIKDLDYRRRYLKRKNFSLTNRSGKFYIQ